MSEFSTEQLESRLFAAGQKLAYPPTPDVAEKIRIRAARSLSPRQARRWLAVAAVLSLVLIAGLLAVPPVRAAVLEFLQIGVIRIFRVVPTFTPQPPFSETPQPTPTLLPSLLDLDGQISLDRLRAFTDVPVLIPSFPHAFGPPDYVFLQDMGGEVLILVWADPLQPEQIELSLHLYSPGSWGTEKIAPQVISETYVNEQPAVWATGPYVVKLQHDEVDIRRLVEGHVLIWVQDGFTYRLESNWPLAEAVKAAESLQSWVSP